MKGGQLGTAFQRRIIFIWEGAVADLPDAYTVKVLERYKGRLHLWDQAVGYWKIHIPALQAMWQIMVRTDLRIDMCVTTRPPEFAQALSRKVTEENWPIRYVFCESPHGLGRKLPAMPDVERVYYGVEEQRWAYGPHGVFFDPHAGQIA